MAKYSHFEFWLACDSPANRVPTVIHPDVERWMPPPVGSYKINVDAAFAEKSRHSAFGVICRDANGLVQWGFVDKMKSLSAFMSEALALKRALMLAMDMGHDKVIFETNCLLLVKSISLNQPDLHDWRCRSIIHECVTALSSKVGFSLCFTRRQSCQAADFLAAVAFKDVCTH